jgi:hypothetical protein
MSDSESSRFSLLIFQYRTLTLCMRLWSDGRPLRVFRLMRKLSVTQNMSAWQRKVLFVQFITVLRYTVSLCVKISSVWKGRQADTAYKVQFSTVFSDKIKLIQ